MHEWRDVVGYEGRYEVSSVGEVASIRNGTRRLRKTFLTYKGYRILQLPKLGGTGESTKAVHVLVAEAFLGKRPKGLQVNHVDGDKNNNTPSNLEWVTPGRNIKHAHDYGLRGKTRRASHKPGSQEGSSNYNAKLSEADVLEILRLLAAGAKNSELAQRFGVGRGTISNLKTGLSWPHLRR